MFSDLRAFDKYMQNNIHNFHDRWVMATIYMFGFLSQVFNVFSFGFSLTEEANFSPKQNDKTKDVFLVYTL